jgi:hypothetical protein
MATINIVIRITKAGPNAGPFNITTNTGVILDSNASVRKLISGTVYTIDDSVKRIILESIGKCKITQSFSVDSYTIVDYSEATFTQTKTGCLWRHLTDIQQYNFFYGNVEPYIIEYPFSYQYQDEILQNVKDYTKAYEYLSIPDGVFNYNTKVETNNKWFNKAILYNGQQSSGLLELVAKPLNNLQAYNKYPIFASDSKTITFTKSDNFYQYNTFWALQKNSQIPLFNTGCTSLSFDKVINESNMDYSSRSFKKAPLRAKDLRIRHILDNSSSVHLVSQFITAPTMNSYK